MTMSFFLHESIDSFDGFGYREAVPGVAASTRHGLHILREKLRAPKTGSLIPRPRLDEMLVKSLAQFNGTLVSGRAGTGKTSLAASFASRYGKVAWYSVDSSDADWPVFARYFAACIASAIYGEESAADRLTASGEATQSAIAEFLVDTFSQVNARKHDPLLVVLDDLHRIFDADWFGEFLPLLLYSLPENTHLLLLCRSKPTNPLWRLRSKQVLNVIDEKLLAFNPGETAEYLDYVNFACADAERAHAQTFGRISKLQQLAGRSSKSEPPA